MVCYGYKVCCIMLIEKLRCGLKNDLMGGSVKILRRYDVDDIKQPVVIKQYGTQNRFLGFNAMGRQLVERRILYCSGPAVRGKLTITSVSG